MKIEIEIKKIPNACNKCQFLSVTPYRVHSEIGDESSCHLGFMDGYDMRDINYRSGGYYKGKRHPNCQIEKLIK